jgi:hypothetical protein
MKFFCNSKKPKLIAQYLEPFSLVAIEALIDDGRRENVQGEETEKFGWWMARRMGCRAPANAIFRWHPSVQFHCLLETRRHRLSNPACPKLGVTYSTIDLSISCPLS